MRKWVNFKVVKAEPEALHMEAEAVIKLTASTSLHSMQAGHSKQGKAFKARLGIRPKERQVEIKAGDLHCLA